MSNFAAQWKHQKLTFQKEVLTLLQQHQGIVPDEVRKVIVALVKTETGMGGALKLVDAAIGKKERATAMKALTHVHGVIEKNYKVFEKAGREVMDAMLSADAQAATPIETIAKCVTKFKSDFGGFETSIAEAIEYLQEEKGGEKVTIISLEGDLKGAVTTFEKKLKPFKTLEKQFKVMDRVDKATEAMRTYSDAAARSEVAEATTGLQAFFDQVDDLDAYAKTVKAHGSKPDDDYVAAIESLCKAMRTIKNQRGTVSMKNLQALAAGNT
jgi:hypothetical protein